ncbi:MAG: hypothetical protein J6J43_04310 [Oscillospiraceae bacterium]|nr:hypothetical protein [Oscillospiraceae bacterium]
MAHHTLHDEVEEVIHHAEDMIHDVLEGLSEEEIISHATHKKTEHFFLLIRNIAVGAAAVLFALSLFHIPFRYLLKAIAYFLGAVAYISEIVILTDCFTTRVPHREMFMAYCFGPMYILLGLSYLLEHH